MITKAQALRVIVALDYEGTYINQWQLAIDEEEPLEETLYYRSFGRWICRKLQELEDEVVTLAMSKVDILDTDYDSRESAKSRLKADKVGDLTLNPREMNERNEEIRVLKHELGNLVGIQPKGGGRHSFALVI